MYIYISPKQKQVQDLIQLNNSNLSKLLNVEQFMQYCRDNDQTAIEFISKNVKQMLDILFTDYDKVAANLYEFYSDLNSKIWEIIDLNLEPINLQIEIYWEVIFDLRWRALVPDTQWGMAQKLFILIKERNKKFVMDQFSRPNFLVSFLPLMHINSVAQIVVIFFEFGFHQQQIDLLRQGLDKFSTFEPFTAINFTYIIHEIMVRIMSQEHIDFLQRKEVLKNMFNIIQREDLSHITLKNAAHVLSLISNHFSMDMQNISLDEVETQSITDQFRHTEFFEFFDMKVIANILQRTLNHKTNIGLLTVKLVEIVDNLIRITDVQLWERLEKANVMGPIFGLVHKFHKADIFVSYVSNMVTFIFDRALNDFHPYWANKLIVHHKIQQLKLKSIDRLIYQFEQKLNLKLIKDGDFLPYFDYLKNIEEELMVSHNWRNMKISLMRQEESHKLKLGEDQNSPLIEQHIIVSALDMEDEKFQEADEVEEIENNIFIQCQRKNSQPNDLIKQNILETIPIATDSDTESDQQIEYNDSSEQSSEQRENNESDPLYQLKHVLQNMNVNTKPNKMANSDSLDDYKRRKKMKRGLSNPLSEFENEQDKMVKSLNMQSDNDYQSLSLKRRSSLQTSLGIKKLNKDFEEFHIDVFNNRKILKNDDNFILKVDEIDIEKETKEELLQVKFQKSETEIVLQTKLVQKDNNDNIKVESVEDIKFRQMSKKDYHFLDFLNDQE